MNSKSKLYFPVTSSNIRLQDCFQTEQKSYRNKQDAWNVHGYEALSCKDVFQWFKMFREGCEDSEYDPRSGQPSTAQNLGTVAKIHNQWPKAIMQL
jgi:hypothetical protein